MADTLTDPAPTVPAPAIKAAQAFVAAHGKPSKAVVENIGRAGARVVLVGADGALGDVIVADPATGEALIAAVADLEASDWEERETVAAVKISHKHRRKMANRFWG